MSGVTLSGKRGAMPSIGANVNGTLIVYYLVLSLLTGVRLRPRLALLRQSAIEECFDRFFAR